MGPRTVLALAAVAVAALVTASAFAIGGAAVPGNPVRGKAFFVRPGLFCGSCHTLKAARSTGRDGANLDKAKPGYARIVEFIAKGSKQTPRWPTGMPAFGGRHRRAHEGGDAGHRRVRLQRDALMNAGRRQSTRFGTALLSGTLVACAAAAPVTSKVIGHGVRLKGTSVWYAHGNAVAPRTVSASVVPIPAQAVKVQVVGRLPEAQQSRPRLPPRNERTKSGRGLSARGRHGEARASLREAAGVRRDGLRDAREKRQSDAPAPAELALREAVRR